MTYTCQPMSCLVSSATPVKWLCVILPAPFMISHLKEATTSPSIVLPGTMNISTKRRYGIVDTYCHHVL